MNSKKWIKIFSIFSIIITIILISINVFFIDSYGLYKKDYSKLVREPNQNFIKMDFLLNKNHSFDSFIFGSSRVGKINPLLIGSDNYYNMTYSEGLPLEHLENIKLLLQNNLKIKNILIGLDDFSYEVEPSKHLDELLRKPHYFTQINDENIFEFYYDYYFKLPTLSELKNLVIDNRKKLNYDILKTGLPIVPNEIESFIEKNTIKHIDDKKFTKPTHYSGNRINDTLKEIEEIIDLSKRYKFNLIFFINPIHITTYLDTDFNNFQYFKKRLSKITEFYDFSGINHITTNNYYYYETSHYRTKVGDIIIDDIFNKKNRLGKLITNKNIEEHLNDEKNAYIDYLKSKKL